MKDRKNKIVHFNLSKNETLHMRVWAFAYQEARKSEWQAIIADRYRFELRKEQLSLMLAKINFFSRK